MDRGKNFKMSVESDISTDKMDRISSFPDDILLRILSDLSTKNAVGTGILASRWRYLWTSLTNLDICTPRIDGSPPAPSSLINSIECVLRGANSSQIQKFRLHSDYKFNKGRISAWICEAIRREVLEVDISVCGMGLPMSFFTCNTIKVLKLAPRGSIYFPKVPDSSCFPKLMYLQFLVSDPPMDLTQNLFRRCPVLEDLIIGGYQRTGCIYDISSPSLRRLSFEIIDQVHSGPIIELWLNTPNLKYFHLRDELRPVDCSVKEFPNFAEVSLELVSCCENRRSDNEQIANSFKLLQGISGGKSISLDCGATNILSFFHDVGIPMFCNLTHLELTYARSCFWDFLFGLLERAPNLEALTIIKECRHLDEFMDADAEYEIDSSEGDIGFDDDDKELDGLYDNDYKVENDKQFCDSLQTFVEWYELDIVPDCLLLRLKTLKFGGFLGMAHILELIYYLLSSSHVLEKLVVEIRNVFPIDEARLRKKIPKFPRASSSCEVQFVKTLGTTSFARLPKYVMGKFKRVN